MRKFILSGNYSVAATKAAFSVYMGSNEAPGNIKRRQQEMDMFLYGSYNSAH